MQAASHIVKSYTEQKSDFAYWQTQPYQARLAALEQIRQKYHIRYLITGGMKMELLPTLKIGWLNGWLLLAVLLAGCAKAPPPTSTPAPTNTAVAATVAPTPTAALATATPTPPPKPTEAPPSPTALPKEVGAWPASRRMPALVYDDDSMRMLLFGGMGATALQDVWTYESAEGKWQRLGTMPFPFADISYGCDVKSARVVFYDGSANAVWAYAPATRQWEQKKAPPFKVAWGAAMAYDAESDRLILFGGFRVGGAGCSDETWAYDYESDTWKKMSPKVSPPARANAAMAYEAEADRVILWGGWPYVEPLGKTGDTSTFDKKVWAYDYNSDTWTALEPTGGPEVAYAGHRMAYSPRPSRVILFGGAKDMLDHLSNETWAYSVKDNAWQRLESSRQPGPRMDHGMVYYKMLDRVILFGGETKSSSPDKAPSNPSDMVWNLWPVTGTWTPVAQNRMVDIGGFKLHVRIDGEGQPAVVLGGVHRLASLDQVQPDVAKLARTMAYENAGIGQSEPGPTPRCPERFAEELHTLLQNVGIRPPYVFVGLGPDSFTYRVFAARYPQEVAGLVFVDPWHEDEEAMLQANRTPEEWAKYTKDREALYATWSPGFQAQWACHAQTLEEMRKITFWPDVPAVILTSMRFGPQEEQVFLKREDIEGYLALDRAMVAKLPQATHVVTRKSVLEDEPHLIIDAVRKVVEAVRKP